MNILRFQRETKVKMKEWKNGSKVLEFSVILTKVPNYLTFLYKSFISSYCLLNGHLLVLISHMYYDRELVH